MRKIAVVGTGSMGVIYAQLLKEHSGADLVAIVGNSEDKTQELAKRVGAVSIPGGSVEELLSRHPDLDGVVVATPEWIRSSALLPLIEKTIPILLEKPLATSEQELQVLDHATQGKTNLISVGHSLRFSPRFSSAKGLLSQNSIGEIRHIYARRNPSLSSVQRVLGKFDLAYWLLCHDVDLIRWFSQDEVEWVLATSRHQLKSQDDYLLAHLKLKSGIDAVCEVSWCSPPVSELANSCTMTLKGTRGILEIEDSEMNVRVYAEGSKVSSPDTYEFFPVGGAHYGLFQSMIDNWILHLNGSALAQVVSFENARAAVKVCGMVSRSLQEKRIVYANEA